MSSKTQNVGHFVEYRLKRIVNSSSDGAVKASLANLRRGTFFTGFTRGNVKQKRCTNPRAMGCLYHTDAVCASSTGQRFAEGIYVSARKQPGEGSSLFDTW